MSQRGGAQLHGATAKFLPVGALQTLMFTTSCTVQLVMPDRMSQRSRAQLHGATAKVFPVVAWHTLPLATSCTVQLER